MINKFTTLWFHALKKEVVFRSFKIALIVGIVLALINHGDRIVFGKMSPFDWLKVIVTFLIHTL